MLQDKLYTIERKTTEETSVVYEISQKGENVIFKAHFPGNPITPGACLIEIGKELCEDYFQKKLIVTTIKSVKFVRMITPIDAPKVQYHIDFTQQEDSIQAKITIYANETICSKISMELA